MMSPTLLRIGGAIAALSVLVALLAFVRGEGVREERQRWRSHAGVERPAEIKGLLERRYKAGFSDGEGACRSEVAAANARINAAAQALERAQAQAALSLAQGREAGYLEALKFIRTRQSQGQSCPVTAELEAHYQAVIGKR